MAGRQSILKNSTARLTWFQITCVTVFIGVLLCLLWRYQLTTNDCPAMMIPGPLQHTYTVIKGADVAGEDLMHVQAQDLSSVKKVCDSFPNCAGFNSNGWLKTKVSDHTRGAADLYIKSGTSPTQDLMANIPAISSKAFASSYEEMVSKMKIYLYEITVDSSLSRHRRNDIELGISKELSRSHFRTRKPEEAHFFFIPIRCSYFINQFASAEEGVSKAKEHVAEIVENIRRSHPYWDRAAGSDHIYVCAHSIGAGIGGTLLKNSIAFVYSADYESPFFIPHKDISLPPYPTHSTSFNSAAKRQSLASAHRSVLAFYAGDMNSGRVRPTLYSLYASDSKIVLFSQDISWNVRLKYLQQSRFCLVIRGKDVWSSDLIDAVMAGCVPVIISDHYHLPLQGVVNWSDFSIVVLESQVSNLKEILLKASNTIYSQLQEKLLQVQPHFMWNGPAKPYDAFYSVMFELWQRRDVVKYKRVGL